MTLNARSELISLIDLPDAMSLSTNSSRFDNDSWVAPKDFPAMAPARCSAKAGLT